MSALPLKADMLSVCIDVRFVPIADIANKQLAKCGARQPTHSNHISAQLNRRHVKNF